MSSNIKQAGKSGVDGLSTSPPESFDIFPYDADKEQLLSSGYTTVKRVFCIRHAEGTHNVNMQYRDIVNFDARLTEKGESQCRALANRIRQAEASIDDDVDGNRQALLDLRNKVQLIVSSPLTRCLQTALLSLEPILQSDTNSLTNPKVLAHEDIRETVNYNCDRRRSRTELVAEFGDRVDFSVVPSDVDPIWEASEARFGSDTEYPGHRESAQAYRVANRARAFFGDFLVHRPEDYVALCSHRAFSRFVWNYGQPISNEDGTGVTPCVGTSVAQKLDDRPEGERQHHPVVVYKTLDSQQVPSLEDFTDYCRADYSNCELRFVTVAFR